MYSTWCSSFKDSERDLCLFRLRHWSSHHICGSGSDADGSARPLVPGALHAPHQPCGGTVAQGAAFVLDRKWICGEYQFDMSAYFDRKSSRVMYGY